MRSVSLVAVLAALTLGTSIAHAQLKPNNDAVQASTPGFMLMSDDLKGGTFAMPQVLNSFGCSGGNVSPALMWHGAPAGTKSFVLTMFDADAPTGSGFWHWVVANLPASTLMLPTGASKSKMPAGAIESRNDTGATGYAGPCPPAGTPAHRYIFTVFAMKVDKIDVTADSSGALVGFNTRANALAAATLTTKYGR